MSEGEAGGADNNNNNNKDDTTNASTEPVDPEKEMKEKILAAQLSGWRNTCDALIAKFDKAEGLRKAVMATNKELKSLLKSGNDRPRWW